MCGICEEELFEAGLDYGNFGDCHKCGDYGLISPAPYEPMMVCGGCFEGMLDEEDSPDELSDEANKFFANYFSNLPRKSGERLVI